MKSLLLSLVAAMVFTTPAFAGKNYLQRLEKELSLTEPQKEQVKTILGKYKEPMSSQRSQLRSLKKELAESMESTKKGDAYRKELLDKYSKVEDIRRAMHRARFEMALEIRELLNDEQIGKLKGVFHKRFHGAKGRAGKHRKHHDQDEDEE